MIHKHNTITQISVSEWSLPLVAPFRVATRTAYMANNVFVQIFASDGTCGIGAAAPVEYITGETQSTATNALKDLAPILVGLSTDDFTVLLSNLKELLPNQPSARAAAEMALYDLWAKQRSVSLWQHFGGRQAMLSTDITIPIVTPDEARILAKDATSAGFDAFKIKIGDSDGHHADLARIAAVESTAPGVRIRIDANQAFTPDAAVSFVKSAQTISSNIEMVEQPVAKEDFDGLRYVRERIALPLFADESARTYEEVGVLIEMGAVDGINVKLMKSGLTDACRIAAMCEQRGIRLMIGCMLESPLGIAAAASLAGGIGGFEFIDLDSHRLLKPVESLSGGFKADGPYLKIEPSAPGWGLKMAEKALEQKTH